MLSIILYFPIPLPITQYPNATLGSFWEYPCHFVCIPTEFHSQSSFGTTCVLVPYTMYLDFSCGLHLDLIEHMVDVV